MLPINYYNELSGLMTDNSIVQLLLKENFRDIYEALEQSGGNLYLNNTINRWLLSIFIQGLSEIYIYFIWDMFLLEGNIILFKAVYAMFIILEDHIRQCNNFDQLNAVLNEVPLEFDKRGKLAYYLISKKFNFNMNMIKKYRKILSPQIIKEIDDLGFFTNYSENDEEKENNEQNEGKKDKPKTICDLDWPICIKDKKFLKRDYSYIVLKELNEPNVIDDYIDNFEEYKEKNKNDNINKKNDEDIQYFKKRRFGDLLMERRKHYCESNIMSIRSSLPKSLQNLIKNKAKKTRKISADFYKKDFDNDKNGFQGNNTINKIVIDVANDNKSKIYFVKENDEKELLKDY